MAKTLLITKKADIDPALKSLRAIDPPIGFSVKAQNIGKSKDFHVVEIDFTGTAKNYAACGFTNTDFSITSEPGCPSVTDPKALTQSEYDALIAWDGAPGD